MTSPARNFIDAISAPFYPAVQGFSSGWLAGVGVLAAGKVWALVSSPHRNASELLGPMATPRFFRGLAVFGTVYTLATSAFDALSKKFEIEKDAQGQNKSFGHVYRVLTQAISIAVAALAAGLTTPFAYNVMFYTALVVGSALLVKKIAFVISDNLRLPPANLGNNNANNP